MLIHLESRDMEGLNYLLVEDCVIVELKAVIEMIPLYKAQLMTYLKLSELRLGLLMNFNVTDMKRGITRVVV